MTWPFMSWVEPSRIAAAARVFQQSTPFPHVVLDGWFDEQALDELEHEFDQVGGWVPSRYRKRCLSAVQHAPLVAAFQDEEGGILSLLKTMTGVPDLAPDPMLSGGGLHTIAPGGKLGIHVDFNRHPELPLARRVNTLLYLNRRWQPEWQGHLTLANRDRSVVRRILPVWNRWVIFAYGPESWHGHPEPLDCPDTVERRSLAVYYYTPLTAATPESHSTIYQDKGLRPSSKGKPS